METSEICLVYPWETPPHFTKLLASTYVGEFHFVQARWDYRGHCCDPFSSNGPG
jgi:hypothetical protein